MKLLHFVLQVILLSITVTRSVSSATCLAPPSPFVPNDPVLAIEYADLIRQDFETYVREIQRHFQCLDQERARAFEEAQSVTQEYGALLRSIGDN